MARRYTDKQLEEFEYTGVAWISEEMFANIISELRFWRHFEKQFQKKLAPVLAPDEAARLKAYMWDTMQAQLANLGEKVTDE